MRNSSVAKEIRIAAVFYGGSSLLIYENGVAQELLRMVRATAANPSDPRSGLEQVYADLAKQAGIREWKAVRAKLEHSEKDLIHLSCAERTGTTARPGKRSVRTVGSLGRLGIRRRVASVARSYDRPPGSTRRGIVSKGRLAIRTAPQLYSPNYPK